MSSIASHSNPPIGSVITPWASVPRNGTRLFCNAATLTMFAFLTAYSASASASAQEPSFSHPGGVAELIIEKESDKLPTVRYGLAEPAILDQESHWRVLIGLDLKRLPGDYLIYVRPSGEDTTAQFEKFQVNHKSYSFKDASEEQPVELTKYKELSDLDFSNSQPPSMPLSLPIAGAWDTNFGSMHSIAASSQPTVTQNYTYIDDDPRTLVKAPQAGIICKIDTSKRNNATVIIDHGRGIFSLLHGVSDLAVELGNGVTVGAVIGKVPDSAADQAKARGGAATRPTTLKSRIYWQVELNEVLVNPLLMTQL